MGEMYVFRYPGSINGIKMLFNNFKRDLQINVYENPDRDRADESRRGKAELESLKATLDSHNEAGLGSKIYLALNPYHEGV